MTAIRHNVSPTVCPIGTTTRDTTLDVHMYQNQNQNQTVLTVSCGCAVLTQVQNVKAVERSTTRRFGFGSELR